MPESETGTTFDKEQFVYDEWFLPSCNDNVLAFNLKESEYILRKGELYHLTQKKVSILRKGELYQKLELLQVYCSKYRYLHFFFQMDYKI